jgi:hypothetical protein
LISYSLADDGWNPGDDPLAGLDEPISMHDIDDVVHGYGSEGDDNDDNNSTSNAAANDTNTDGYDEEGMLSILQYIYIHTYIHHSI